MQASSCSSSRGSLRMKGFVIKIMENYKPSLAIFNNLCQKGWFLLNLLEMLIFACERDVFKISAMWWVLDVFRVQQLRICLLFLLFRELHEMFANQRNAPTMG